MVDLPYPSRLQLSDQVHATCRHWWEGSLFLFMTQWSPIQGPLPVHGHRMWCHASVYWDESPCTTWKMITQTCVYTTEQVIPFLEFFIDVMVSVGSFKSSSCGWIRCIKSQKLKLFNDKTLCLKRKLWSKSKDLPKGYAISNEVSS